jgi:RHS repeat-associated protein
MRKEGNTNLARHGRELSETNRVPVSVPGYYYDSDLAVYYLRARTYDAAIGRFLSRDPLSDRGFGAMGRNWSINPLLAGFNQYEYSRNSPMTFVDPTGCIPLTQGSYCRAVCLAVITSKDPVLNPGSGGGVYCSNGIMCACLRPGDVLPGGPKYTPGMCPTIDDCIQTHEENHFKDVDPCSAGPVYLHRPRFRGPVDGTLRECQERAADVPCLNNLLPSLAPRQTGMGQRCETTCFKVARALIKRQEAFVNGPDCALYKSRGQLQRP